MIDAVIPVGIEASFLFPLSVVSGSSSLPFCLFFGGFLYRGGEDYVRSPPRLLTGLGSELRMALGDLSGRWGRERGPEMFFFMSLACHFNVNVTLILGRTCGTA